MQRRVDVQHDRGGPDVLAFRRHTSARTSAMAAHNPSRTGGPIWRNVTVDLLTELDAAVKRDGALVESPQGVKAHPAAVEARQQRIALARILAALRLPAGDEEEGRPQRRVGVRGTYSLRSAS